MSKWNKVEDKLPPLDKHILVWCPQCLCVFGAYMDSENGNWYCANDFTEFDEDVTHWCNMPKRPKEEA